MATKLVLRKSADGNVTSALIGLNGQAIAMSQPFEDKASALKDLASAYRNLPGQMLKT
jgi:uncharacterized protein YegP (UPF0339 family)